VRALFQKARLIKHDYRCQVRAGSFSRDSCTTRTQLPLEHMCVHTNTLKDMCVRVTNAHVRLYFAVIVVSSHFGKYKYVFVLY